MVSKIAAGLLLTAGLFGVVYLAGAPATENAADEAAPAEKADCCAQKLACCENGGSGCCVASTRLACCEKGMKCCAENKACCNSPQACCAKGEKCCDESKACCGKPAADDKAAPAKEGAVQLKEAGNCPHCKKA